MPLTLPNLDDRRWADLVDEGRALIPVYAPGWTDHNVHDPGITLMELFAWIAEMDIYRLNRIPESRRRKFLSLLGIEPRPARGAHVVLALNKAPGSPAGSVHLPAGVEFQTENRLGEAVTFRTSNDLNVVAASISAIQSASAEGLFVDLLPVWRRREALPVFGSDPRPGAAFYLGFDKPLPPGEAATIWFEIAGGDAAQRRRLTRMLARAELGCRTPAPLLECDGNAIEGARRDPRAPRSTLRHHSVKTIWEAFAEPGEWIRLQEGSVLDETRSLTLDGRVVVTPSSALRARAVGECEEELFYLRCRMVSGAYDDAPRVTSLNFNGVRVVQEIPVGPAFWSILESAEIAGEAPQAGESIPLRFRLDERGKINSLRFREEGGPSWRVLDYQAPSEGRDGGLSLQAIQLGSGSGRPFQTVALDPLTVAGDRLRLFSLEGGQWIRWESRPDFDASIPRDSHFKLDLDAGQILFGDGDRGRVVPEGAPLLAAYSSTLGEAGNLDADLDWILGDSASNRVLLSDLELVKNRLGETVNRLPATGGRAAESLDHAVGRAFRQVETTNRAVSLADFERLALGTPGARVARVQARANRHPAFPCFRADGIVTVLVLPHLPADRPSPSPGLIRLVSAHLATGRVLGTRVEVAGPVYVEVTVRARVQALPGAGRDQVKLRVVEALNRFLHPLQGGPEGGGWDFGRHVYRSEALQAIDETPGVDHVLALEFVVDGQAGCGNVCLPPRGLPASGNHEIEVLREGS